MTMLVDCASASEIEIVPLLGDSGRLRGLAAAGAPWDVRAFGDRNGLCYSSSPTICVLTQFCSCLMLVLPVMR